MLDCIYPDINLDSKECAYVLLFPSVYFTKSPVLSFLELRYILNNLTKQTDSVLSYKLWGSWSRGGKLSNKKQQQQNFLTTHRESYRTSFSCLHLTNV